VRLAPATIPITARIGADQFLRGGESRRLPPGSYDVVVSAPGYLPTRLTVEALPGVTAVIGVSLFPETAGLLYVAARPWGKVLVDGKEIGYTSVAGHRIAPGPHAVRLQRDQAPAIDTTIVVAERQTVRLAWTTVRDSTGEPGLDSALAALDGAETERGAQLLRQLLDGGPTPRAPRARATTLLRLAAASWSLNDRDSARAYLRAMVEGDPFYVPSTELLNPDLLAAYGRIRHETPAIGIRTARDTVLTPSRDTLHVSIAVGQPGLVRLLLRLASPRPRDSLLVALTVDSVAVATIPLTGPDGSVLPPGLYALEGEVAAAGRGASDLLQLSVERLSVDTMAHAAPIAFSAFRPETKRAGPSRRNVAESIALGALVIAFSAVMNDPDVSGRGIPSGGWLIGGAVAIANFAFKRDAVPVPENIAHNAAVRAAWEAQNRSAATDNAMRLRAAPLRIRTTREP
jgi:hypothetical protein